MKEIKIFTKNQNLIDEQEVTKIIQNFDTYKNGKGKRNVIKIIPVNGIDFNIKAFKIPNLINQIVYRNFRKSKAHRSFEYANKLLNLGIKTPFPIAFFEYIRLFLFKKSYYISTHQDCDLTYRELINQPNYPDRETILRQFTQFTFLLHEKQINFLDHSPGNTLIKKTAESKYEFYLVDLNRMRFMEMTFDDRMKNFAKLSPKDEMLAIMSNEYAKLFSDKSEGEIVERMSYFSDEFSSKYKRKERFKKKYFFWK